MSRCEGECEFLSDVGLFEWAAAVGARIRQGRLVNLVDEVSGGR
jgi:hypothetical protein